jgi:hypothetical protein
LKKQRSNEIFDDEEWRVDEEECGVDEEEGIAA